jgi:hypothetical protein
MTNTIRTQIANAKAALVEHGWREIASVMHDGGATGDFGTIYMKEKETVFVNFKTAKDILYIIAA